MASSWVEWWDVMLDSRRAGRRAVLTVKWKDGKLAHLWVGKKEKHLGDLLVVLMAA
jgi:hypothetical protein